MFDAISDKFTGVFRTLTGKGKISESNVADAMREVRVALLEADVNMTVAKTFVERVKQQALGEKVLNAVDPGEQFVKIIHDELVTLLGGEQAEIQWKIDGISVFMLCGLQGAGKTTTAAKLARRFKDEKRRPLLVAADVQRPAAVQQLQTLGEQIGVPVYAQPGADPVAICTQALEVAKLQRADTLILDTAGRLHVDDALMHELERIQHATNPGEILFVCDAMIGQSAVDTAAEFSKRLPLTGAVMTKLDSDARGGAALSLREVTGVPIKFITVGEKMDALEPFHPDRLAGRILGMGDVVSLVEKAQAVVDEKDALAMQQKLLENRFTLEDFQKQMQQLRSMGGIRSILGMLPGMGHLKDLDIDEKQFKGIEAIIQSMTPDERQNPEIIHNQRRERIAKGCGKQVREVSDLLKQFGGMKKMVDKMGKAGMFNGGMDALGSLMGGGGDQPSMADLMPGAGGGGLLGSKKGGTKAQKDKKKEKRKRKQQKKNKKRRK